MPINIVLCLYVIFYSIYAVFILLFKFYPTATGKSIFGWAIDIGWAHSIKVFFLISGLTFFREGGSCQKSIFKITK
jgi:uncharacterized membrane protein (DUF485 family)